MNQYISKSLKDLSLFMMLTNVLYKRWIIDDINIEMSEALKPPKSWTDMFKLDCLFNRLCLDVRFIKEFIKCSPEESENLLLKDDLILIMRVSPFNIFFVCFSKKCRIMELICRRLHKQSHAETVDDDESEIK